MTTQNKLPIRSIDRIIAPPAPHMVGDGFRVHNFIPGAIPGGMERTNPFIMLDYGSKHYFPPSEKPRGVGVHPHRGFETVTIAYQGKVAHHDSAGNSGIIGEGEVQWMTAASGILHKEYHEEEFSRMGGNFQMVQLWVNLPAAHKMSPPKYQAITKEMISRHELPGKAGSVEVISGEYGEVKGPATTFTPVHLMNANLKAEGEAIFSFPQHYLTALLVIEGEIIVNEQKLAEENRFVLMANDGNEFSLRAISPSIVLVMSAEPINEPIAAYGPFVMNTRDELIQAYADVEAGKFGFLSE
ncbi:MAG: pirin family protein [Bacteroidales bacterium]|nr:pirin family protein [Bacteroidales bacterium]